MLDANIVGRRAAERFRKRFSLSELTATYDAYGVTVDAHDYLHTLLGALPGPLDDEMRVLALEESIVTGRVPLPRGLMFV